MPPRKPLIPPGSVLIALGVLCLAPLVYNSSATENGTIVIPLLLGISFLIIGFTRRSQAHELKQRAGELDTQQLADGSAAVSSENDSGDPVLVTEPNRGMLALSRAFRRISVGIALLSLGATLAMAVFAKGSGGSGVPLAIGLLLAAIVYGLSSLCKALAKR